MENGHTEKKKPYVALPEVTKKNKDNQGFTLLKTQDCIKGVTCFGCRKKGYLIATCKETSKKERKHVWDTKEKEFKDNASTSTKNKTKKMTRVINQAVKEVSSSEEEEDEDEKGAVYTMACIKHLMTLGQGHKVSMLVLRTVTA